MHYLLPLMAALLGTAAQAHLSMVKPAPINHKSNKYTVTPDYNYASPLAADGRNYPCKGYHTLLGTPEGTSVETWAAGSVQTFTTGDGTGAVHGGGSCQASISEDGGLTFKVVKSFIGNCPIQQHSFSFTVPIETKPGNAIFAWTWFNKIGNREMYMNCASVTITGGGTGLSAYPDVFTANIGGTCSTPEGIDVVFPNPGKDVETASKDITNPKPPVGECGSAPTNSTTSSSSVLPSPSASPAPLPPVDGCMCTCGGLDGYIVNIVPAGPVDNVSSMGPPPSSSSTAVASSTVSKTAGTAATPDATGIEGSVDTAPTDDGSAAKGTAHRRHRRAGKY